MTINDIENIEEQKKQLHQISDEKQKNIDFYLQNLKSKVVDNGKLALWVGGVFLLTYIVISSFFGDDDDDDAIAKPPYILVKDAPQNSVDTTFSHENYGSVYQSIIKHMAGFLIAIAKEKLLQLIDELKPTNEAPKDIPNPA
ncbi:MAG: hypothetical protein NW207_06855 [Cytophagales bacterium]|nr:hypothetical protein [Cytophagales bacterium]